MVLMKNPKSPVLLIVFNRPHLTKLALKCVEIYKPERLYIVADGPRLGNSKDNFLCKETRRLFDNLSWDCEIIRNFREENLGCRRSVSEGISWFFSCEEKGIILEDDIEVSKSFFYFCDELLEKYKDEERVSMITGTDFSFGQWSPRASYGFSYYSNIWGWATWRRAWKDYDVDIKDFSESDPALFAKLDLDNKEIKFWKNIFALVKGMKIDTWDFQWVYTNFKLKRVSINPKVNMVSNLGFASDATHTNTTKSKLSRMPRYDIDFPLNHPDLIQIDKQLMSYSRNIFLKNAILSIIINFLSFFKNRFWFNK